jgi:Flp pilus assembly protein TadB
MAYGDSDCKCTATHSCGCYDNPQHAAEYAAQSDANMLEYRRYLAEQKRQQQAQRQIERQERRRQRQGEPVPIPIRCLPIAAIVLMLVEHDLVLWAIGPAGWIIFTAAFVVIAAVFWEVWQYIPKRQKVEQPQPSSSATVTRESSAPLAPQVPTWRDRADVIAFPDRTRRTDPPAVEPQEVA